jgi:hypothetical protein
MFTAILRSRLTRKRHYIFLLSIAPPFCLLTLTHFKSVLMAGREGSIAFKRSRSKKPMGDGYRLLWLQGNEIVVITATECKTKLWSFWTLGALQLEW